MEWIQVGGGGLGKLGITKKACLPKGGSFMVKSENFLGNLIKFEQILLTCLGWRITKNH